MEVPPLCRDCLSVGSSRSDFIPELFLYPVRVSPEPQGFLLNDLCGLRHRTHNRRGKKKIPLCSGEKKIN